MPKKIRVLVLLFIIISFAAFLRLYHMPDRPFGNDVWLWTIGINLHELHFFNIGAHVTENFFESLICTPYGWADTLPTYVFSGIYNAMKIPLNEYWIYAMHVMLIVECIILIYAAGTILFNRAAGFISAFLLAVLPIDITAFGSGLYYHHAFLMFLQLVLLLAVIHHERYRSWYSALFLSASLFLIAGTETVTVLPAVFLFQCFSEYRKRKEVSGLFGILVIYLPAILLIALNLCVSFIFRESNLAMFGYALGKYNQINGPQRFMHSFINQFAMAYRYFFGPYFLIIVTSVMLFLFTAKEKIAGKVLYLLAWFSLMFFVNVCFGQGFYPVTFRYSHYFIPLILIAGYMTYVIYEWVRPNKAAFGLTTLIVGAVLIFNISNLAKDVLGRKVYHDDLKSASFYVREHGDKDSTIFQLIPLEDERNYRSEYYFGKSFMEPPGWTGFKRQLFSLGWSTIDAYKKAYGLNDFDFYIDYTNDGFDGKKYLQGMALNRVSDIERAGKPVAAVYSPHDLGYRLIDADQAGRDWDRKYASIGKLLQNRWVGLAVLRGYHHRLQ